MVGFLFLIFFTSGFSALVFETLWFRQAGLMIGNSVWASSLVLSSFMGGLALGNAISMRYGDRLENPLRVYAAAEILIAFTGAGLVFAFPLFGSVLSPFFRPLAEHPLALNIFRWMVAMSLLLVPCTALGLTLPLFTKTMMNYDAHFGSVLGKLYGVNTLGAVAGALISETVLVGALGIRQTALVAGLLNVIAGFGALKISNRQSARIPLSRRGKTVSKGWMNGRRWLWAAFSSGFCVLALEVIWFRFLLLFVTGHSLAFALMLGVVLAGIGLGGLIASRCLRIFPDIYRFASPIAFFQGVLCVLSYAGFPWILEYIANPPSHITSPLDILSISVPLMFPISLFSGLLFTFIGAGLRRDVLGEAETTGALTLSNTAGAVAGSLGGGFLFLPAWGTERSFYLIAILYGILGASLIPREKS